ncbi:MAG TPA: hypothetical protein VGI70_05830, partial [Polyangiales bacterium]
MEPRRILWSAKLACAIATAACSSPTSSGKSEPAVTLRFRPEDRSSYREHWVYDVELPAKGIMRRGYSFDVTASRPEGGSLGTKLRHTVRRQYYARDGQPEAGPQLLGATMNSQWGSDRSLDDSSIETQKPDLAAVFAAISFGMLIEYPDQPVAVSDSWSIEPRTLPVGPGLDATLRPSFTLEAIEQNDDEREVRIASDIQVDLLPRQVGDGVVIEGGGTASSTLRVRVNDGLLLDARTVLHFNQEIGVAGNEVLGYRELSASAHVFVTRASAQPNLAEDPRKLEPADPEDDRECAALLDSATDRLGRTPTQSRLFLVAALHADSLPTVSGAAALREAGTSLVITSDPKRLELDGRALDPKDLAKSLRSGAIPNEPIYVYADASLSIDRLHALISSM